MAGWSTVTASMYQTTPLSDYDSYKTTTNHQPSGTQGAQKPSNSSCASITGHRCGRTWTAW